MIVKKCEICKNSFEGNHNTKYCNECAYISKKQSQKKYRESIKGKHKRKEYGKKYRKEHKKDNIKNCKICGILIESKGNNQYCMVCGKTIKKEKQKEYNSGVEVKERQRLRRINETTEQKENRKLYMKEWRGKQENKEKHRKYIKEYVQVPENKVRIRQRRKEQRKNRYNNDLQYNLKSRLRSQFNMAKKAYLKHGKIIESKNMDYESIFEKLTPFPKPLKDYEIDHIIPLSFFDLTDKEQIKKAWNPINLQWLPWRKNDIKDNKIDFEKYPEQKEVWKELKLDILQKPKGLYSQISLLSH